MGVFHIRAPQYENQRNQRNQNTPSNQSNQRSLLSIIRRIPNSSQASCVLSTPSPFGYYPYLRGRVSYGNTAPANCPPEKVGEEGL